MALPQFRKKRNRYVMNLEQKINVLDRLARGEGPTSIGLLFNVNESTIRTIKRNEDAIRASVFYSSSTSVKVACIPRDHNIEKTEKILHLWITEQLQKGVPLTVLIIREKAKRLYNHFLQNSDPTQKVGKKCKDFNASKGWFEKFKKRYKLQNIKLSVESEPDSVIERLEAFDDMELSKIEDLLQKQEIQEEQKIDIVEELIPKQENTMPEENFENVNIKTETYSDEETEKPTNIDLHLLNQGILMAYQVADHFTAIDPDPGRSLNFRKKLEMLLQPYQELQQQTVNSNLKKE